MTPPETPQSATAAVMPLGRRVRLYALEARYEFLKLLRLPVYAVPTLAFPVLFYVFFGLSFRPAGGGSLHGMASYLLATYGAFGVIGASLFGFGVGVATERGQGWMLVKRATPMPVAAYFSAKLVMAVAFSCVVVLLLSLLGALFGGVELAAGGWLTLGGILVAGAVPFSAFGLFLGYLVGPNAAPAVVNLVYLPLAFASGLWIPVSMLPGWLRGLAPFLPPYHYAQLALKVLGSDEGQPAWVHLAALGAFTLISLALATVAYWRDEGRTYG